MNDKNFKQQVIHHLVEQRVPTNYDPWKMMQSRFEISPAGHKVHQKANIFPLFISKQGVRFAVLAILVLVLAAGTISLATPSGQVIAQSLLSLFIKTDSDVHTLPDEHSVSGDTTTGLSIEEAEKLAKFDVVVPISLPDGYSLANVVYNSLPQEVIQIYKYTPYQSGEMFILTQQVSIPSDSPIGQSAEVEQLQIGNTTVESVSGSWFAPASSNIEKWISDAPIHTFRWQKDGLYFTFQFWVNDTFSPAYLSEDNMREMVETFIGTRPALSKKLNLNNLKSQEEANLASGMQVLAPTVLPEGFVFSRAVYEQENRRVVLIYQPENSLQDPNSARLVIFETPVTPSQKPDSFEGYPPEALQKITNGQFNGTFIHGAVVNGTYDPDFGLAVEGQTNSLNITIQFYNSANSSTHLGKEEMISIAESLK